MLLKIVADDAGYSRARDEGICAAAAPAGIARAGSILINGMHAEQCIQWARCSGLPLGLHVNLTEGRPVSPLSQSSGLLAEHGCFLGKMPFREAAEAGAIQLEALYGEVRAQLQKFVQLAGRLPAHVDGHQHVHVVPEVAPCLLRAVCDGLWEQARALGMLGQRAGAATEPALRLAPAASAAGDDADSVVAACAHITQSLRTAGVPLPWVRMPILSETELSLMAADDALADRLQFTMAVSAQAQQAKKMWAALHFRACDLFMGYALMGCGDVVQACRALNRMVVSAVQHALDTGQHTVTIEWMAHPGYVPAPEHRALHEEGCGVHGDDFAHDEGRRAELQMLTAQGWPAYLRAAASTAQTHSLAVKLRLWPSHADGQQWWA